MTVARANLVLIKASMSICIYAMGVSIALNTILCVDIILMIRDPFKRKESRMPKYITYTLISPIPTTFFLTYGSYEFWRIGVWNVVANYTLLVFSFIVSVIYTCRKLHGPGMSAEVRELVMRRHIVQIVAYIITFSYVFSEFYAIAFSEQVRETLLVGHKQWFYKILKTICICQGFINPILRLFEPAFFYIVKKKIVRAYCTKGNRKS